MTHLLHRTRRPILPRDLLALKTAGTVLCGALLCVGLQGCASRPSPEPVKTSRVAVAVPEFYVVQRGDTVSKIAARYGLSYPEIGRINQLDSQYTIYPNQRLRLRRAGRSARVATTPSVAATTQSPPRATPIRTNPPISAQPLPTAPAIQAATSQVAQVVQWQWPTANPILQEFNSVAQIKGVRFGGQLGDPVVAAADGAVVYANNGLPEYGNLVLLRHAEGYITAYAHNRRLLVQEGQTVRIGQPIAEFGDSGSSRIMLEFQIRKNGKPINPRQVLPQR